MLFPISTCSSLDFYHSDHRPIYTNLRPSASLDQLLANNSATLFRFEAMWTREEECEKVIAESWQDCNLDTSLSEKLKTCSLNLKRWAQNKFRSLPNQIKNKKKKLAYKETNLASAHCFPFFFYFKKTKIGVGFYAQQERISNP